MAEEKDFRSVKKRLNFLKSEYENNWRDHHAEISEFLTPRRGRYLNTDSSPSTITKRYNNIIDDEATKAHRTLASGMHGGLTSSARPWAKLTLADADLAKFKPVRAWLDETTRLLMAVLSRSNFYNSVHNLYGNLGGFGIGAMLAEEDFKNVIRFYPFSTGEYYVATDEQLRVDTLARVFWMTANNITSKFGANKTSDKVKSLIADDQGDKFLEVAQLIEPNGSRDITKEDNKNMPFSSVYFEYSNDRGEMLSNSGYDMFPVMAPRWSVEGSEVYGRGPGMDALGNTKMLQKMSQKSLIALDKLVDPPMNAPLSLKNKKKSMLPGAVNYTDPINQGALVPTYQVRPDFQQLDQWMLTVKDSINRTFYSDLFAMIQNDKRNQRATATEIAERHEEKLVLLGPVIERVQPELLDLVIDRTFDIMERKGMIPEPPEELVGVELEVEYVSLLAQAQKIVGTSGIEQLVRFGTELAQVKPEAVDKLDSDVIMEEYADMVGVPANTIRTEDEVNADRQARQQAQQVQQQADASERMVEGAKKMSETQVNDQNALEKAFNSGIAQDMLGNLAERNV